MEFDNELFNKIYSSIKDDLSYFSRQMIDTMYEFITKKMENNDLFFSKKGILSEYENLSRLMENNCDNKLLLMQVKILGIKIQNNDYYFDLLVKLECALGIKPNDFFISIAQLIFNNDIYSNIIDYDNYSKDELLCKLESILGIYLPHSSYCCHETISEQSVIGSRR